MEKFTANYANTSRNFTIQNLKGEKTITDKYYAVFCILKNLLHRGCPTIMSDYLQGEIGKIHSFPEFKKTLLFIDTNIPNWNDTIKGNFDKNEYPARDFFEKDIPKYLEEYKFIQQLIIPEVLFSDITGEYNETFVNQQVDFYLPQAKLVIEIDGQQHKRDNILRINDKERDDFLSSYGVATIRINTKDIYKKNDTFMGKIRDIEKRLMQYKEQLYNYKQQYISPEYYNGEFNNKIMVAVATMRFQTAILSLLERNTIKLTDNQWNFNILNRDVEGFAELAVEDIFIWLKHLCKLNKLEYLRPKVNINYCKNENEFSYEKYDVNIDFSLLRRWTDENIKNPMVIYIRTDYNNRANYFKVSTADPIQYNIINDGEDSDIPSLEFILKNLFGFDKYRDGQLPIIINSLSYNDTIGLLPTGAGKSLCYQISALLQPCISFVVCPIKSLMYDQKYNTDKRFITNTNYITSDQSAEEKNLVSKNFSEGKYNFIWISPERFQIPDFREYLDKLNREQTIALAVIDEVHCLSEWGHDFRTSYLNLIRTIRKYCPSTSLLGLTATASSFVLEDLKSEFELDTKNIKTLTSFTRPELKFYVKRDDGENLDDKKISLFNLLTKLNEEDEIFKLDEDDTKSGLIFTLNSSGNLGCYSLSNEISSKFSITSRWYSGGIPTETKYFNGKKTSTPVMDIKKFDSYKISVQKDFQENKFPLLVATKAFGMGIDKNNIRYTIHYGIPSSLEALYQEAGRAGRDRKDAQCYVLYTKEDMSDEEINILFHPDSTIEEIEEIHKKFGYKNGRDILRNFFFWLNGNKGVDYEFKVMNKIYSMYAKQDSIKLIECGNLGYSFSETQKAIYKLSLLGIIDDWTIKSWNEGREKIEVEFSKFDSISIYKALNLYINRYDKEFELNDQDITNNKYRKYIVINRNELLQSHEKSMRILLEWNYDNIVYNRRQSIKNILELCDGYSNPDTFKEGIEIYFRFSEKTYILDHIAQNPRDLDSWFDIFYKGETIEKGDNFIEDLEFVNKGELEEIKGSISRLLESYRYNTGLNYVSGIVRLLLGEYDNQDGRYRLESALKQIITYDENEKQKILEKTLEFGRIADNKGKEELSELLCEYYPNKMIEVYISLEDNYSLSKILEGSTKILQRIGKAL